MDIRNPIFNADGSIDCEIFHPDYKWIPFTASSDDIEQHGRDIYQAALDMGPADYVSPPPPSNEEIAAQVRAQRNRLLSASDWTQVADAPVDQAAWATYRQALRDVPQQDGFPGSVVWPTEP
jgi:hypothetical protein